MPLEHTGVDVDGNQRIGIQIVSVAHVADEVRPRIAGAPVGEIGVRVVGARHPGGCAAVLPAVARPGLVAGLARSRHSPEAPRPLAGAGVVGVEEASHPVLGARDAHDDLVFHRQGRTGHRVTGLVVGDLDIPPDAARAHVERDQVGVDGRDEDLVAKSRDAPIHLPTTRPHIVWKRPAVGPDRPSRLHVERDDVAWRIGDVHDAVKDQGRGLEVMPSLHLIHPHGAQLLDVGPIDLVERREALGIVGAVRGQPAARLAVGLPDTVVAQLRRQVHGQQQRDGDDQRGFHRMPSSDTR